VRRALRPSRIPRPALAAVTALLLAAGGAVARGTEGAGPPAAADTGLQKAAEVSGKTVPVRAGADKEKQGKEKQGKEKRGKGHGTAGSGRDNHGARVSEAARNGPPAAEADQYRNHGEWVSSVARDNHGAARAGEHGKPGR
jgi:hypothetical protein